MRKEIRLYNIIFPMWGLYFYGALFPVLYLLLLPANFLVDSVVLLLLFALLRLPQKKDRYQKLILKTWLFGFLADILASAVLVGISTFADLPFNPYLPISSVPAFLFATTGVVLGGLLIYAFQRRFVLRKIDLPPQQKHKIALGMAILTAPYLMYLPPLG